MNRVVAEPCNRVSFRDKSKDTPTQATARTAVRSTKLSERSQAPTATWWTILFVRNVRREANPCGRRAL